MRCTISKGPSGRESVIAGELRRRYAEFGEVPESILDFMDANRR